jgi:hypothetical protein
MIIYNFLVFISLYSSLFTQLKNKKLIFKCLRLIKEYYHKKASNQQIFISKLATILLNLV